MRLNGERRAADAQDGLGEQVAAVRAQLLDGESLAPGSVAGWLEEKSQSGRWLEDVTTRDGNVVRRERPAVEYPDSTGVAVLRVPSTPELEPLRRLAIHLARRYGWQPAQATVYVLSGVVPVCGVRLTTRETLPTPGAPTRWTVDFDSDEDAEVVAQVIRQAQRDHEVHRRLKAADAERLARLTPFVAEHGTGVSAWQRWNRENPDDRYKSPTSFNRVARKVLAA